MARIEHVPAALIDAGPIVSTDKRNIIQKVGQVSIVFGALYALWCVALQFFTQFKSFAILQNAGTETEWAMFGFSIIVGLGAAIPGLFICWAGYWLNGQFFASKPRYETA